MTDDNQQVRDGTAAGADLPGQPPEIAPSGWIVPPQPTWQDWPQPTHGGVPPTGSSWLAYAAAAVLFALGILVGGFALFAIVAALIAAGFASNSADAEPAGTVMSIGALAVLVGIAEMIAAIGVGFHQVWARWLGILLVSICALALIWLISPESLSVREFFQPLFDGREVLALCAWVAANGFVIAALLAAGTHFRPSRVFARSSVG